MASVLARVTSFLIQAKRSTFLVISTEIRRRETLFSISWVVRSKFSPGAKVVCMTLRVSERQPQTPFSSAEFPVKASSASLLGTRIRLAN